MRLNDKVIDTRTNRTAMIVAVDDKPKGLLYTVQYGDNDYGRYYKTKFNSYFKLAITEQVVEQQPKVNYNELYKNVTFVDFKNKIKFANYESWLAWAQQFNKAG